MPVSSHFVVIPSIIKCKFISISKYVKYNIYFIYVQKQNYLILFNIESVHFSCSYEYRTDQIDTKIHN